MGNETTSILDWRGYFAQNVVELIIYNLRDRRGLKQEWEQIGKELQIEIADELKEIVICELEKIGK